MIFVDDLVCHPFLGVSEYGCVGSMKQEARALLGRLEYDRGNYEKALQTLEEVKPDTFIASLRFFITDSKTGKKKRRHLKDSNDCALSSFLHGASLVLEALYLKAKCLQELARHSGMQSSLKAIALNLVYASPQTHLIIHFF